MYDWFMKVGIAVLQGVVALIVAVFIVGYWLGHHGCSTPHVEWR